MHTKADLAELKTAFPIPGKLKSWPSIQRSSISKLVQVILEWYEISAYGAVHYINAGLLIINVSHFLYRHANTNKA